MIFSNAIKVSPKKIIPADFGYFGAKFMQIAERFGKSTTSWILNYSQMAEMLALPEGDEEKFIEEKAAEGKPVEDMTVKTLRAEVANSRC